MVTWALENGIDTSDSMKARGYGLKGRTSFSIFRFDGRDKVLAVVMGALAVLLVYGLFRGFFYFRVYPTVRWAGLSASSIPFYLSMGAVFLLPVILRVMEDMRWKHM
jgi:energy-coupling factor transport system permease protein